MKTVCILLSLLCVHMALAEATPASYKTPAVMKVTTAVAAPDPGAWTATITESPGLNLLHGGEYEGWYFRTKFYADADGTNCVPLSEVDATSWNGRREGFYDGAGIRVYRIRNGKLVNICTDTVGHHRASGWNLSRDKVIPPGHHSFQWSFQDYNSPDAPYYFSVVSLNKDGTWSRPSNTVQVQRPKKCEKQVTFNDLMPFQWPKEGPGKSRGRALATPGNFAVTEDVDGIMTFTWKPVTDPDLAGYCVLMSDYPPEQHLGYGFDLASVKKGNNVIVKKGDLVFVDLRRKTFSRRKDVANRVWGDWGYGGMQAVYPGHCDESTNHTWELVTHPGPIPAEFTAADRGETCLKIAMSGGKTVELSQYNYASPYQQWYHVLEGGRTYVLEFWARQEGMATPNIHFGADTCYRDSIKADFTIGSGWRKYTCEFVPDPAVVWPKENKQIGRMILSFAGPGTLWLDCWRIYPKDQGGYMKDAPEDLAALRESGLSFLRLQRLVGCGGGQFLQDTTNPAGVIPGHRTTWAAPSVTMFSLLSMVRDVGSNPWLQIEMCYSEAEWRGLVEYLAAPYDPARDKPADKPWAWKRYSMGQKRPWTDEFKRFILEISNETWNPLFHPFSFNGQEMTDEATGRAYRGGELTGLVTEFGVAQMKQSPYWKALEPKLEPAVGGWLLQLSDEGFGQAACKVAPSIKHNLVANYNGGWDEGADVAMANDHGRRLELTVVPQYMHRKNCEFAATRQRLAGQGYSFSIGTYEAGPGYAYPNTITKEQEEAEAQVMKSLAAGTGTLDCFLDAAQQGFQIQNFFHFGRGRHYWSSHALPRYGGQAYPAWKGIALYNQQGQGDFLAVQPVTLPTDKLEGTKTRKAVDGAPLTSVYATRKGKRYAVFVLSRKMDNYPYAGDDGFTPVTLELPFKSAGRITLYKMAGDPRATNLDGDQVRIEKQEIPSGAFSPTFVLNAARGADDRGLPPAATFLYVFEDTATPVLPANPRGSIMTDIGQPAATHFPVIRMLALFDRKLSGLTADKIKVKGTAGGIAEVEWPVELAGTGCRITVSELVQSGDVSITIPAGALQDEAGRPNAEMSGGRVQYAVAPAQDRVMVSETFDTNDAMTLWSGRPAAGWKGNWMLHNVDPNRRPAGYEIRSERPLEYPGMTTTPTYLSAGVQYNYLWRWLDVEGTLSTVRRMTKGNDPAQVGLSGTTLWLSCLVRKDQDNTEPLLVSLNAGEFYQEERAAMRIGYARVGAEPPAPRYWSIMVRDAANKNWVSIPSSVPVEIGKTTLLVARLTFGSTDKAELFVNPLAGATAPARPDVEHVFEGDRRLRFRNLVLAGGVPGNACFDEIRLGDSFKAVTR